MLKLLILMAFWLIGIIIAEALKWWAVKEVFQLSLKIWFK